MTQHRRSTWTRITTKCGVQKAGEHDRAKPTTAGPWCLPQPVVVVPPLPPIRIFLLWLFSSRRFCAIKTCSFSAMDIIIPPPFYHSSSIILLVFSLDQRERGRGEDCKDSMPGLRSKDSSVFLAEHFFSFSSLFSILDSYFVILT